MSRYGVEALDDVMRAVRSDGSPAMGLEEDTHRIDELWKSTGAVKSEHLKMQLAKSCQNDDNRGDDAEDAAVASSAG